MSQPLVSVVIPTYNRARDLVRCLNSLREQTYSNWEAIVVDNHSQDETDQVIRNFNDERVKVYKVHNNGVIAVSRNLGIKKAEGEYVAFLDSDDWWTKNKLAESVKHLNDGADVVFHDLYIVKSEKQKWFFKKTYTRDLNSPIFNDLITNGNPISNSSAVVRKEMLDKIGGLSEESDLVAIEDFDAWLKISRTTENFKRISKTLGYYWVGGGNTSNPARLLKNVEALRNRYENIIAELKLTEQIYWLPYAKGKAYYHQGDYQAARSNLMSIELMHAPLSIYLKSRIFLWMMKWSLRAEDK